MIVMTIASAQAARHLKKKFIPLEAATSFDSLTSMLLSGKSFSRAVFRVFCFKKRKLYGGAEINE